MVQKTTVACYTRHKRIKSSVPMKGTPKETTDADKGYGT